MKARQKPIQPSNPSVPNTPKPIPPPLIPNPTGPARGNKELPESALFLLRDLWSHLGYTGDSFVEMQMEISRELDRADFARFEREMICNEVIGARTEVGINSVKASTADLELISLALSDFIPRFIRSIC